MSTDKAREFDPQQDGDKRGPRWSLGSEMHPAPPTEDTAPRSRPHLPDPSTWGLTESEAREKLRSRMCPVCGEGPWKSPLNHVSRKHGISRHDMRDVCGLSTKDKVTAHEASAAWSRNGTLRADDLNGYSAKAAGNRRDTPARVTLAESRRREDPYIVRWAEENPRRAAEVRAGFRERVTTPEALEKWRKSMERARSERVYTDEERARFVSLMSSPRAVANRRAAREARNN